MEREVCDFSQSLDKRPVVGIWRLRLMFARPHSKIDVEYGFDLAMLFSGFLGS